MKLLKQLVGEMELDFDGGSFINSHLRKMNRAERRKFQKEKRKISKVMFENGHPSRYARMLRQQQKFRRRLLEKVIQ